MIYFQRFYEKYRYGEDEKISDSFHEGINILPFTANPATSNFDNTCSIKGITGEFFRYNSQVPANPVLDYTQTTSDTKITITVIHNQKNKVCILQV